MKIGNVTFDCADPDRMSTFWAAVLGYEKRDFPEDMRQMLLAAGLTDENLAGRGLAEDPAGVGPRFLFQRVPEGKQAKNRVHLDINSAEGRRAEPQEVDAEMKRIVALGATVIHKQDATWGPWPEYHYVMADPEGNEFCVQ
ncbi:VOC family protein [Actinopolymorpha sp. B9G3]|uniref:VOC family protein n=1 Tax=Actinopolymorpha sp. B9G3 TaxID=3158970 RepID=UPI0032D90B73